MICCRKVLIDWEGLNTVLNPSNGFGWVKMGSDGFRWVKMGLDGFKGTVA
jgi:hypothetical protein